MTTRLLHRIASLERRHRVAGPQVCPECGTGPSTRFDGEYLRSLRVTFDGDGDETPVHCPSCGRKQVFQLEFDRLGDDA